MKEPAVSATALTGPGDNAGSLPRIVFLGGLGRSGSTLIERLLGEIAGTCSVGETVHMWERGVAGGERCGCGLPFLECSFWRKVGQAAFGGWEKIDLSRVNELRSRVDRTRFIPRLASTARGPGFQRALDEYLSYYQRVYAAVAEVSGSEVIIDSSKHASLAFCLASCPSLDVRIIHLVRDSRAVAYSWTKSISRPEAAGPSYMTRWSPATTAVQWNTQNGALHVLARSTPTLRVRYEDLVRAPETMLRRIAAFAELRTERGRFGFLGDEGGQFQADLNISHTVSGNPMRFSSGRMMIRPDERWQAELPVRQRRIVTGLTFPLLRGYGYVGRTR